MRKRGLTLIEVLLAVTILSVSLTVLLTAATRCLAVMRLARMYPAAQWAMGLGELEHPFIKIDDLEDLEVDGEEYPGGFVFSREIEDEDSEDKDNLHIVRTRITWSDRGRHPYEETVRYVFQKE